MNRFFFLGVLYKSSECHKSKRLQETINGQLRYILEMASDLLNAPNAYRKCVM